jgi:UDP-N-acetyl-D-glucosamine dehydrogenase
VELTKEFLKAIDGAMITTAHKKGVDYEFISKNVPFVFDTKNVTKGMNPKNVLVL